MPDTRVQDEQGNIHVFPDGTTPEMMAKALNVKAPGSAAAPNLKTGEGMEEASLQQAHRQFTGTGDQGNYNAQGRKVSGPNGEPLSLLEKAAQQQNDRQARLGSAMNRASNSPTPVTNASMVYAPMAAAKSLIGAKVGSKVGGAVAGEKGQLVGGILGGIGGGMPWSRAGVSRMAYTNTGEVKPGLAAIGDALEHPTQIPGKAAKALGNKLFPPPPIYPGASLPSAEEAQFHDAAERAIILRRTQAAQKAAARTPPWETPGNPGATQPTYEGFAQSTGQPQADVIERQLRLDKAAARVKQPLPWDTPVESNPGAVEPTYEEFAQQTGSPQADVVNRQLRLNKAAARAPEAAAPEPNGEGPAPSTARVYKLPEPRALRAGEKPGDMANIRRNRLLNQGRQARPGAGEQLQKTGNNVIYVPPESGNVRSVTKAADILQGNETPFAQSATAAGSKPLKFSNEMGLRWATDGTYSVTIPKSVPADSIEEYARHGLAEQARLHNVPWMRGKT